MFSVSVDCSENDAEILTWPLSIVVLCVTRYGVPASWSSMGCAISDCSSVVDAPEYATLIEIEGSPLLGCS